MRWIILVFNANCTVFVCLFFLMKYFMKYLMNLQYLMINNYSWIIWFHRVHRRTEGPSYKTCSCRYFSDKMPEILGAFSIIRNGKELIKYNKNNDLNMYNGLKVSTMVLVLFGHKFLYFAINPIMFGKYIERVMYKFHTFYLIN